MLDNNKIDVKLPKLDTKPVSKLIEAISDTIGNAFDPEAIKARAEARGVALVTKTKAEIHAMELRDRAQERLLRNEARRQSNMESITIKAMLALPNEVAEQKPEEDWIHNFFEQAQDVGDEQMQTVWAKLLAGEVSKPGSYSVLTISTLKRLGKREADLFTQYCSYVWQLDGFLMPITRDFPGIEGHDSLIEMSHSDVLRLQDHGLISLGGISYRNHDWVAILSYYGWEFPLKKGSYIEDSQSLTVAGDELALVSGSVPDTKYMKKVLMRNRHLLENSISDEEINNLEEPPKSSDEVSPV